MLSKYAYIALAMLSLLTLCYACDSTNNEVTEAAMENSPIAAFDSILMSDSTETGHDLIENVVSKDTLGVFDWEVTEQHAWIPMQDGDGYGFYDTKTEEYVIKGQYEEAGDFSEGWAAVKQNGKWMFIDSMNQVVLEIPFEIIVNYHPLSGEVLPSGFSNGLCRVWENELAGFINKKGKVTIPIQYKRVGRFYEGLAVYSIEDPNADEPEWETISGILNTDGKVVVKAKYDWVCDYENGFSRVMHENKIGFFNRKGKLMFPLREAMAWSFSEGLAFMCDVDEDGEMNYEYYVVDTTGKVVLPGPYGYAGKFVNGKSATSIEDEGCVEINTKGEIIRKLGDWDCQEGC